MSKKFNSWKKILLIGSLIMATTSSIAAIIYFSNDLYSIEIDNVQKLIENGDYAESIKRLELLSTFGNKQSCLKLAKLYNLTGDYQKSISLLKKKLGYKNNDRDYMRVLASAYRLKGDVFQEQDMLNTIENKYGLDEELLHKRRINSEIIKKEKYKYREKENFELSDKEKLKELEFDKSRKLIIYKGNYNKFYATLDSKNDSTFLGEIEFKTIPDQYKVAITEYDRYVMMSYLKNGNLRDFYFFRIDRNNMIPLAIQYNDSIEVVDSPKLVEFAIKDIKKDFKFEINDRFSSNSPLKITAVDYNFESVKEKLFFTIVNTYTKGKHSYKVSVTRCYDEKIGKFFATDLNAEQI